MLEIAVIIKKKLRLNYIFPERALDITQLFITTILDFKIKTVKKACLHVYKHLD